MKRTTVYLSDDLVEMLDHLSEQRGVPQAALIREALEQYGHGQRGDSLASIGAGGSGHTGLSARFDELLFAKEKPPRLIVKKKRKVKRAPRR